MGTEFALLVDGVDFGEGPRWHEGRLWYSDFFQRAIYAVSEDGTREAMFSELADQTSGLGWLPDGSLLAVFMTSRKLMRSDGASFAPADLALVRPDGTASVGAKGLAFPNGSVITPDGGTLIVGQSFGGSYQAFTIGADATLSEQRMWAEIPGTAPDGCCLDAAGGIWFSDAIGSQLIRVLEGGEVTDRVPTPMPTFACMLGGSDGRTLFALCAPDSHPDQVAGKAAGAIYTLRTDHPGAGRP
jgi:sugar lactone lactonase YvrE